MKNSLKVWSTGVALTCVAVTTSDAMSANMTYFVNQTADVDNSLRDVDFSASSVPTGSGGATNGLKVWNLELATNNGKSQCFELSTSGNGNGDTRFWVGSQSLNDDSNGTLYSTARVWLVPPNGFYEYLTVSVAAYNSSYNSMLFSLNVKKFSTALTQSQCVGSGPAVKSIQGTVTFVNPT